MRAMQALGVPYRDEEVATSVDDARAQAQRLAALYEQQSGGPLLADGVPVDLSKKRVVALIAYLERLGRDLANAGVQVAAEDTGAATGASEVR